MIYKNHLLSSSFVGVVLLAAILDSADWLAAILESADLAPFLAGGWTVSPFWMDSTPFVEALFSSPWSLLKM